MFFYGALEASSQLNALKDKLNESFDLFSFDFEGHGGKFSDSDFTIDLFVQNTLDFLTTNNLSRVSFFEYSMGVYVALKFASIYPEKVEQIITYGTKFA